MFSGFVTAWRLATCPTSRSPSLATPRPTASVRAPSWLTMTVRLAAFHDGDDRVGRAEVDSNHFCWHMSGSPNPMQISELRFRLREYTDDMSVCQAFNLMLLHSYLIQSANRLNRWLLASSVLASRSKNGHHRGRAYPLYRRHRRPARPRARPAGARPAWSTHHAIDLVIANAENAAAGFGITREIGDQLLDWGVDVMTSGNHIWDKKEALDYIGAEPRLLRPANYPAGAPGNGSYLAQHEGRPTRRRHQRHGTRLHAARSTIRLRSC